MTNENGLDSAVYKLNTLFEACNDGTQNGIRDAAMISLMAEHKLRVKEVAALPLHAVYLTQRIVTYKPVEKQLLTPEITMLEHYKQKHGNAGYTTVALSERAAECLTQWLEIHNGE